MRAERVTAVRNAVFLFLIIVSAGVVLTPIVEQKRKKSQEDLAELLAEAVLSLGIQWGDPGKRQILWLGTGFVIEESGIGITAGHVIQQLVTESNDLASRDLNPVAVAGFADGRVVDLQNLRIHPELLNREKDSIMPHAADLGLFRFVGGYPIRRLKIAGYSVRLGEDVAVAGFPVFAETLAYSALSPPTATVKFGRIERIIFEDTYPNRGLIQHGIPVMSGFSGGPMVNRKGEVVGIVNASTHLRVSGYSALNVSSASPMRILHPGGINFAVHSNTLRLWLEGPDSLVSPVPPPA